MSLPLYRQPSPPTVVRFGFQHGIPMIYRYLILLVGKLKWMMLRCHLVIPVG